MFKVSRKNVRLFLITNRIKVKKESERKKEIIFS